MANDWLSKLLRFSSSLELAVVLILVMAGTFAAGTIYEAKYGAAIASQMIYRAWWTQILLFLFIFNLGSVCISRWPWRPHHVGFLVTHLGLITLLGGGWITARMGVDGNIALSPGESGRMVRMDQNMLYVFKTVPGKAYELIFSEPMEFDLRFPSKAEKKFSLPKEPNANSITIHQFLPRARREVKAEPTTESIGIPAVKMQLNGSRASFSEWLFLQNKSPVRRDLGPASIVFQEAEPNFTEKLARPTLVLYTKGTKAGPFLAVANKGERLKSLGKAEQNKSVATGWMDFTFTLLEYVPTAIPKAEYFPIENQLPNAEALQAMELSLGTERVWLEIGSSAQISDREVLYYVQFAKRQVDIGFDIKLDRFHVGYYEGTNRPRTYSSDVDVLGTKHEISMNEPLKWGGFTFYQASYESDEEGNPRYSVLSVNRDPGRWVKYVGSLLVVFGIISMFYFKPKYSGTSKWLKKEEKTV